MSSCPGIAAASSLRSSTSPPALITRSSRSNITTLIPGRLLTNLPVSGDSLSARAVPSATRRRDFP